MRQRRRQPLFLYRAERKRGSGPQKNPFEVLILWLWSRLQCITKGRVNRDAAAGKSNSCVCGCVFRRAPKVFFGFERGSLAAGATSGEREGGGGGLGDVLAFPPPALQAQAWRANEQNEPTQGGPITEKCQFRLAGRY